MENVSVKGLFASNLPLCSHFQVIFGGGPSDAIISSQGKG